MLTLPHLWQKPGAIELLEALSGLRLELPTWNLEFSTAKLDSSEDLDEKRLDEFERREAITFLTTVISSPLAWIEDEQQQEAIWSTASQRMAERCGRTAMGEMTRRWHFPSETSDPAHPAFDLVLREPGLTGSSLGLKTWGSAYVFARLLTRFAQGSHLSGQFGAQSPVVLELGSGTGLLGLAAACIWRAPVVLTDRPEIVPNLEHNVEANRAAVEEMGGRIEGIASLTWGSAVQSETDERFRGEERPRFRLVVAADVLYDDEHPALLAQAIDMHLVRAQEARGVDGNVLVMAARRERITDRLLGVFREELASRSEGGAITCLEEGMVPGMDDWDRGEHIECWWGLFRREPMAGLEFV